MAIAYDVILNLLPSTKKRIGEMSKQQIVPTEEERAIAHQLGLDPAKLAQQVALNSRRDGGDSADRSPYISFSIGELRQRGDAYHQVIDQNPRSDDVQGLMLLLRDKAAIATSTTSMLEREAAVREIQGVCTKLLNAFRK
jgi:hypothetical protein